MGRYLPLLGLVACLPVHRGLPTETAPPPAPAPVELPPPPSPVLPESVDLPADFEWRHAGPFELLTPIGLAEDLGSESGDFLFLGEAGCSVLLRPGVAAKWQGDCPRLGQSGDVELPAQTVSLQPRLFGRDLVDGAWPVEGLTAEGWQPGAGDLEALVQLLNIPQGKAAIDILKIRVHAQPEGRWIGLELTVKSAPIEQFGRWQLAMRYGKDADYRKDVLSWGDGERLVWALRLSSGGFGLAMTKTRIRLVLVSGAAWEPELSALLNELPPSQGLLPVPGRAGLSVELAASGLRLKPEPSPLSTRALIGQLRTSLSRWIKP